MSREIKFRAWDNIAGSWYGDSSWDIEEINECSLGFECSTDHKPDVIWCQFTGLRDSEGREIYEGDIAVNERGEKGVIEFSCGAFGMRYVPPFDWDPMEPVDGMLDMCRVLGNIHEHPHLLNNEQEEK